MAKQINITEEKAKATQAGGVLVGKRKGQTIVHDKGTAGGYLVGRLHDENGIKAVNKSTGQPLEMQGGEVVITAPAVADQQRRMFEGEMLTNREILSRINSKGGGVSFAEGGEVPSEIYFYGNSYEYGGKTMTDYEIINQIKDCGCDHEKGGEISAEQMAQLFEKGGVPSTFWGSVAGGVLVFCISTKRFLLLKRSKHVYEPNTWGIISGKMDEGETSVIEAVVREAEEETGYQLETLQPSYVFKSGQFTFYNFIAFVDEEFVPKLNWENTDYGWFELEEFPENLHFGVVKLIENEDLEAIASEVTDDEITQAFEDGGVTKEAITGIKISTASYSLSDLAGNTYNTLDDLKEAINEIYEKNQIIRGAYLYFSFPPRPNVFLLNVTRGSKNTVQRVNPETFKGVDVIRMTKRQSGWRKLTEETDVEDFLNQKQPKTKKSVAKKSSATAVTAPPSTNKIQIEKINIISLHNVIAKDKSTISDSVNVGLTVKNFEELKAWLISYVENANAKQITSNTIDEFSLKVQFAPFALVYYLKFVDDYTTTKRALLLRSFTPADFLINLGVLNNADDLFVETNVEDFIFDTATPVTSIASTNTSKATSLPKIEFLTIDGWFSSYFDQKYRGRKYYSFEDFKLAILEFQEENPSIETLSVRVFFNNLDNDTIWVDFYNKWLRTATAKEIPFDEITPSNFGLSMAENNEKLFEKLNTDYSFGTWFNSPKTASNQNTKLPIFSIEITEASNNEFFEKVKDKRFTSWISFKKAVVYSHESSMGDVVVSFEFNDVKPKWTFVIVDHLPNQPREINIDFFETEKFEKSIAFHDEENYKKLIEKYDLLSWFRGQTVAPQSTNAPESDEDKQARIDAEQYEKNVADIRTLPQEFTDEGKLDKDIKALIEMLPFFQGASNSIERAILLKELGTLVEKKEKSILSDAYQTDNATSFFTPQNLLHYYFQQARQSPVAELDEPCGLPTPNGEKSKLPIGAYLNVRTPHFKNWFGDWEKAYETGNYLNCSVMIDEETKEPQIYYHGVRQYVEGSQMLNTGSGIKRPYGSFEPPAYPASFFTDNLEYAKFYAGISENQPTPSADYSPFIYKVFLNVKNPVSFLPLGFRGTYKDLKDYLAVAYGIIIDYNPSVLNAIGGDPNRDMPFWNIIRNDTELIETMKNYGYDALFQEGDVPTFNADGTMNQDRTAWMVESEFLTFYPNQVKSVLAKKSFYFKFFNDIRFKNGGYVCI